ncbi:MAG: AAA family ATPase, partial [Myxococcales bacterium]|nr:AAA family ATPase [Myxococcales bacterium]
GKLHEFDLDADLVLISGPNGHGKSSLLDALLLVLSGDHSYLPEDAYHSIVDDNGTPVSEFTIELEAVADVPGQEEGQQREEKEIIIRVQGGPRPDEWTWHWGYEASEKKRYDPATWLFRRRDPEGRADRMERRGWRQRDGRSLALLSAYLNDRRLDDRAQASPQELVGRVLEPLKEPLEAVRKRVDDALESLKKKLEKLEQDEAAYPDERQEQIRQDFAAWVPAWRELMVLLGEGRPDWLPLPAEQAPALWMDWARARLGPGREVTAQTLFQWIRRELETQYNDQARRASQQSGVQATDDTLQQLQQLQNEYNQLQQQREGLLWNYPTLDLDLAWLYPEGEEQPGLPEVFRLLANHIHTWQQGSPVGLDRQVQQELAAVVEERAAFCHQRVHELVTSLRQARRRLRETETRLKELEQKIARLRSLSERLQRLADARGELDRLEREDKQQGWLQDAIGLVEWERRGEERQKERERLAEEQKHLQGLQAELEQLAQPDERVLRFVMEAINRVMVRFAEPGRFWPLRLEGGKLKTADGRRFDHFSSGQRAQTSMAGMVAVQQALIELLGDDFPHRLLLLDDASASYDLANLSREALLWRQLAYHPDRAQRRQIFLATHHEDLTNRQLDLLVPLPGQGTMRALHFVSWDPQTGPQWQTFDVKPPAHVASDDQQARQRLADDLRRELCLSSST